MDHLLTDLKLALTIGLNNDVGCCLVFRTTFLHQICDERNRLVVLKQRTVMVVFYTLQDRLRFCGKEYNTAVFLNLKNVSLSHGHTTPTR